VVPADAKICTRYRPAGCLFATLSDDDIVYPEPLHPISFDMRTELPCLFHGSGVFENGTRNTCKDPFMTVRTRPRPTCAEACCDGGVQGRFRRVDQRYTYTPADDAANSSYHEYTRNEVGRCMVNSMRGVVSCAMCCCVPLCIGAPQEPHYYSFTGAGLSPEPRYGCAGRWRQHDAPALHTAGAHDAGRTAGDGLPRPRSRQLRRESQQHWSETTASAAS
jgi:hypothetical protein